MIKVNEYFGGSVKSLGFDGPKGYATIGIITPGIYEFGTATVEYMTVIAGTLHAQLPNSETWEIFNEGATFKIDKDLSFKVRCDKDVAYRCYYE